MKHYALVFGLVCSTLSVARADTPLEDDSSVLIDRRTDDLKRTQKRIDQLVFDTEQTEKKLGNIRLEVGKLERALGQRARFVYKLNRRGGSFRYLLTADSVLSLLKRAGVLRHLINDELFVLRDKGRTIAELSSRLSSNAHELHKAQEMLKMLQQTVRELRDTPL